MSATIQHSPTFVPVAGAQRVLTPEAMAFLADLHARFDDRRNALLSLRAKGQEAIQGGNTQPTDSGASKEAGDGTSQVTGDVASRQTHGDATVGPRLGFRADTQAIRDDPEWRVAPIPPALHDRRVEITGPVDRKMMINALNSGAKVFMADFEDSHSPTWAGTIAGQINLQDAVNGRLTFDDPDSGKHYAVGPDPALLVVRVRGLHLDESHVRIGGRTVSGALFDFAMAFFHNAKQQAAHGTGPFYYLPKLESAEEAKLWDDVFTYAETTAGLEPGTIKATVLIETLPAAFQMEEILHALRTHIAGLNAGRWDYIFSCIKTFRDDPTRVLPDRGQVTMTAPFMRAYTELLVKTCHKRGAFAMGGMSAFIPDKRDPERNEKAVAAVRADKTREATDGFDGTWVAHPGLVDVALDAFDDVLKGKVNQVDKQRHDVEVTAERLLDFRIPGATCTLEGLRTNIDVGIRYIDSWLAGRGAAAIHGLMEDAATAEISRSQVWQWVRHSVQLEDGRRSSRPFVKGLIDSVATEMCHASEDAGRTQLAAKLFLDVALAQGFPDFLTLIAYPHLEDTT